MDKLTMAHDWAMKHGDPENFKLTVAEAWEYADLMQAEADKRIKSKNEEKRKALSELLNSACNAHNNPNDWQPDWSQAPNGANIWQKSSADNYYWYCGDTCLGIAPSFDYQGPWQKSLRKRPEGK